MKARDLANVGLKLLGLYWLVLGADILLRDAMLVSMRSPSDFGWKFAAVSSLLFVILYGVMGYLCVFRTSLVLRLVARDYTDEIPDDSETRQQYGSIAFSLLGAFVAIPAFGNVLTDIMEWLHNLKVLAEYSGLSRRPELRTIFPDFASHAATLLIGIALIMGRKRFGALWKRLRPIAVGEDDNEEK